jgi:uncharacterized membrane protein YeaQ/YmgE (transglycosylase-associated protein family)
MGIVTWIVLGLVAGVLAKIIMSGRDPGGIIITIVLGIAGAGLAERTHITERPACSIPTVN